MTETKAKQTVTKPTQQEEEREKTEDLTQILKEIRLEDKTLSTLLGEFIESTVRNRATFANSKQTFKEWYDLVSARQPDRKEFAKIVMQCCDTMRLAAEGLYHNAMEIVSGDR